MKSKKGKSLIGRVVMVHPYLTTDPLQRQGEIGKITDISSLNKEVLTVEFKDGKRAAYLADGLLTLFPKSVMRNGLAANNSVTSVEDRKLIQQVLNLASAHKQEEALKLAMTRNAAKFYCLVDCANYKRLKRGAIKSRKKGRKL